MHTQYIPNPGVPGHCVHNTAQWQVTELMGGLAAELLQKSRKVDDSDRQCHQLSLHDCYPSVLFQGDEAAEFLRELAQAQANLPAKRVDELMLSAYTEVLAC